MSYRVWWVLSHLFIYLNISTLHFHNLQSMTLDVALFSHVLMWLALRPLLFQHEKYTSQLQMGLKASEDKKSCELLEDKSKLEKTDKKSLSQGRHQPSPQTQSDCVPAVCVCDPAWARQKQSSAAKISSTTFSCWISLPPWCTYGELCSVSNTMTHLSYTHTHTP